MAHPLGRFHNHDQEYDEFLHDHSDSESATSTEIYEHEAFETFQQRVRNLVDDVFPNNPSTAVERMEGGSFNRIIGVTLADDTQCIVRVPRFVEAILDHEAAVLSFLNKSSQVPVPFLHKLDTTMYNQICSPYTIQSRIQGQSFYHGYDALSLEEKQGIVKEMVKLIAQLDAVTFDTIGLLRADDSAVNGIRIGSFDEGEGDDELDILDPPTSTVKSFLETRFRHMKTEEIKYNPEEPLIPSFMDAFLAATEKLVPNNLLEKIILYHPDFFPRNILVHQSESEPGCHISGVIDWDQAAAAPIQMAYELPSWLWLQPGSEVFHEGSPEYTEASDKEPADAELLSLKNLFEEEIGKVIPNFMEIIRSSWRLKELLEFAAYGLRSEEDTKNADAFLKLVGIDRVKE